MRIHRLALAIGVGFLLIEGQSAEAQVNVSVNDRIITEGSLPGTKNFTFTVTRSVGLGPAMTVNWATADTTFGGGTDAVSAAGPGQDYVASSGTVNWNAGVAATTRTFTVVVNQDTVEEDDETFVVNLTTGAGTYTITDPQGLGTIATDDRQISIGDVALSEGTGAGNTAFGFTVSLSGPSAVNVSVRATTSDVTAQGAPSPATGFDYVERSNILVTIPAGSTSANFNVNVKKDPTPESNETFEVTINTATNGVIALGGDVGTGTIVNDDTGISIGDAQLAENGGTMTFVVTRTDNSTNVTYSLATANIAPANSLHAAAGSDYTSTSQPGLVLPLGGSLTYAFNVPIINDGVPEAHETFAANLTVVSGATITDNQGIGTINNDDAVPASALKISEFRYIGPGGAADQFIEIANTTASPITIGTVDLSPGFGVWSEGTQIFTILNGNTIPARGHFLGAAGGYTLAAYGTADAAFVNPLAPDAGIALFDTANVTGASVPLDAVGFNTSSPQYVEGPGMTPAAIPGPTPLDHSFVRKYLYGGGSLQDGTGSAADFTIVAVNPATYGGPATAVLGGPSPENLSAETERTAAELQTGLCDPIAGQYAGPDNYVFTPATATVDKFIELRRTITNLTGTALTGLRAKATSLSTLNSNGGGGQADYRVATSATFAGTCTANALTLENPPVYQSNLGLSASGTMGGLNSSLRSPVGLTAAGPGSTVGVNFKLYYTTVGVPGFFWVTLEAKP